MSQPQASATRTERVWEYALSTPGYLPKDEATGLYETACRAAGRGFVPFVEIGSYRGRSSLVLAAALCRNRDHGAQKAVLFSIDHHRGSEEMQTGWADHDPELVDPVTGRMDSLPDWRRAVETADVEDLVIGILGDSRIVAGAIAATFGLVFLDGGHGAEIAWADYQAWSDKLVAGGYLVIHDVFPDPADGGRPPYECYRDAIDRCGYREELSARVGSLRVLRKPSSENN